MDSKMGVFIRRFKDKVVDFYNIPEIVKFLKTEIERKRKIYPFWKKKVRFSYASFKKRYGTNEILSEHRTSKNILQYFYHDDHLSKDKVVPDENLAKIVPWEPEFKSMRFFLKKFPELFIYFLTEIFPFSKNSLRQTQIPIQVYRDLFFDFQYAFTESEIKALSLIKDHYSLHENLEKIVEFLFSSLIHSLGLCIGDIIPDNFQIEMISGFAHLDAVKKIDFVISIRQRERNLKEFFLNSHIFQFSEFELFVQLPLAMKNKLRMQKDLIYLLALERYFSLKPYIISVLARIQKKCVSLRHVTPLLDILNFMFSRVEDSIYDTQEIIRQVNEKYTDDANKREILLELFEFCNKNAVLFGTFQSNNRSQLEEQYRLFFSILQFYGEGIERPYESDNVSFPNVLNQHIQQMQFKYSRFSKYFELFERFLQSAFQISSKPAFKIVFKQIFLDNVDDLNEDFFSAFNVSLNKRLFTKIEQYNQKFDSTPLSYFEVVDFIIKTIYHSIKTIFLEEDPLIASKNFRDSISRYSPKNIALRSLELLFFKEIPLSDNNWINYNLSRNKEKVIKLLKDYIKIPKDYFFTDKKLLHISMKYFYSLESETTLEEWLGGSVLDPFFEFIDKIWKNLDREENVTKNTVYLQFNQLFSRSIINPQTLDYLEAICEIFADIFSDVYLRSS